MAATLKELPRPAWRKQPALLARIFTDPTPVLEELADAHGPMYQLGFGPSKLVIIGDPHAMREMFAMGVEPFRWNHKFNLLAVVVGPNSMMVADGDDWSRLRKPVQGAFSRRRLNGWIPMILERTDAAIDALAPGRNDMYLVGRSLVLEIVVRALFGERLAARSAEIGELFQRAQDYLEAPSFKQIPHPIPKTKRAQVRADGIEIRKIIDEEMAYLRANPSDDPNDVLAALVREGELSDDEIKDQVATLMGAGYNTTAATLSWMFWCVSLADGLWERLRAEADEFLTDPASADATTLANLDLADRVMRETIRLHPAGVISPREAGEEVVIGGYRVPKGALIAYSPYLSGRSEEAWTDPLSFDPERFVDPSPEQKALADISWVPFGRGARNCIGFALAQMEMTLIVSRVAQRLDIEPVSRSLPKQIGMVVNRPEGGTPLQVTPRR